MYARLLRSSTLSNTEDIEFIEISGDNGKDLI